MKKNILFVMPSLAAGGGEKSLVNLLTMIDFSKYNVDLLLLNKKGIFMDYLPEEVSLPDLPVLYQEFTLPLFQSLSKLMKRGKITLAFDRIIFTVKTRQGSDFAVNEQKSWKNISKSIKRLDKEYDVAVGFLEKTSIYFCVEKVKAERKIGWIHNDYKKLGMNSEFDMPYMENLDDIVTVSEECKASLADTFPAQKSKIKLIYNIVSPRTIHKLASEIKGDIYNRTENETIILTIGRLHFQKGYDLAIEACKKLISKGRKVKWYVIGEGLERDRLTYQIKEYRIEDNFILLGTRTNPYPYIKQADIYAQPSKFEGKSIAVDEAKILSKPILVTNYSTAKDQIANNKTGLIVDMQPEAIETGLQTLMDDNHLRSRMSMNLQKENLGTESEINKIYHMFGGDRVEEECVVYNE